MTSPEVLSDSDRPICLICNINCVIYAQLMDSLQTFEDYIPSTKIKYIKVHTFISWFLLWLSENRLQGIPKHLSMTRFICLNAAERSQDMKKLRCQSVHCAWVLALFFFLPHPKVGTLSNN